MKHILALLLILAMTLSLAACGSTNNSNSNGANHEENGAADNNPDAELPDEGNSDVQLPDGGEEIPDSGEETEPDDGEESKPDEGQTAEQPALSSSDFTLRNNGDTYRITVSNLPAGAQVTWSTSDEAVATVAEDGTVTAVAKGNATITAEITAGGETVKLTCIVRCRAENAAAEGDGESGNAGESAGVDLQALATDISADLSMMGDMTTEVINSKIIGLDGYTLKQVVGKQGMNIIQPMELIFVECSSASDASAVAELMESYVAETMETQGWYPPYAMWEDAAVITEGNFVGLIVAGDSQSSAESAFRDGVK